MINLISLDFAVQLPNCISRISTCLSMLIPRKPIRQMCELFLTSKRMLGNVLRTMQLHIDYML